MDTQWKKADIFYRSTVRLASDSAQHCASIEDALAACLDSLGRVDIATIAKFSRQDEESVVRQLSGGRIFRDPATKQWLTDDAYLSGNVAAKLAEADALAAFDTEYQINVQALRMAQPALLMPGQIYAPLGAGWIPAEVIEKFFVEMLEVDPRYVKATYAAPMAEWFLKISGWVPENAKVRWGTERVDAVDVCAETLSSKMIVVYDLEFEDGKAEPKKIVNRQATVVVQAKQAELQAKFEYWLWADDTRASLLADIYNKKYNVWRVRQYNGDHLTLPGLSTSFTLRKNQTRAIWRAMQSQSTMLDHQVGAGKTLAGICSIMECRRIGLVKKAMIVAPNNLVGQWHMEILSAYPSARVLMIGPGDFGKERRSTFMSRIATGDWDMVVVPYSSFKLLPMSAEAEMDFIESEIDLMERYLWTLKAENESDAAAIKKIERSIKRFEARLLEKKAMAKDSRDTITFEMLGIDMLVVDEFHSFKNLFFRTKQTRIAGLPNSESQRAFDMFMKVQWLLGRDGKVLAITGTPISNTIAEAFTMQRYLQGAELIRAGVEYFDAWSPMFALATAGVEMSPDGAGFRLNTRYRKFKNLPELYAMWAQNVDSYVIAKGDLEMPTLHNGGLIKVKCKRDPRMRAYVRELAARADKVKTGAVEPEEDNMLKISSDGAKAALDLSLVIPGEATASMPKIDQLVEAVAAIYFMSAPTKGTQIVFCDLATPKAKRIVEKDDIGSDDEDSVMGVEIALTRDIYAQIERRLVARGVKSSEIVFAHEAKNTGQRMAMYRAVNKGEKRIVIASTEKMGLGVNVQERLLAIHHLTPTWRPDGLQQRTGRMERPGNRYPEVFEFVFVTPGSFDGYKWQTLESKLGFIADFKRGKLGRETDDIGDDEISYAALKAMSSGNPLILRKVELDTQLAKMNMLRQEFISRRASLQNRMSRLQQYLPTQRLEREALAAEVARRDRSAEQDFSVMVAAETFTEREAAGKALMRFAMYNHFDAAVAGEYRGFPLVGYSVKSRTSGEYEVILGVIIAGKTRIANALTGVGVFQSIDSRLRSLDKTLSELDADIAHSEEAVQHLIVELGNTWEQEDEYTSLAAEVSRVDSELRYAADVARGADDEDIDLSVIDNDDSWLEPYRLALGRIATMHCDQQILAAVNGAASVAVEIPQTPEVIVDESNREISRLQARADFASAIAQSVAPTMAEWAKVNGAVKTNPRRKSKDAAPSGQLSLGF